MTSHYNPNQLREKSGPHGGWWEFEGNKVTDAARKAAGLPYGDLMTQLQDQGFSISLDGKSPTSGYMVSPSKDTETSFSLDKMTQHDINRYAMGHLKGLMGKNMYLGGWNDAGKGVLDMSRNFFTRAAAIKAAIAGSQKSIYIVGDGYIPESEYYK